MDSISQKIDDNTIRKSWDFDKEYFEQQLASEEESLARLQEQVVIRQTNIVEIKADLKLLKKE